MRENLDDLIKENEESPLITQENIDMEFHYKFFHTSLFDVTIQSILLDGAFGKVYLAKHAKIEEEFIVIKTIDKNFINTGLYLSPDSSLVIDEKLKIFQII